MKKRILILWTGLLAVALCACSSGGKTVTVAPEGSAPAETAAVEEPAAAPAETAQPQAQDMPLAGDVPQVQTVAIDQYAYNRLTLENSTFTMDYPSHWNRIPASKSVCFEEPVADGLIPARVVVTSKAVDSVPKKEENRVSLKTRQLTAFFEKVLQGYDSYEFSGDVATDGSFLGDSAAQYVTYTCVRGESHYKGYAIIALKGSSLYVFHFRCAETDYERMSTVMMRIRDSSSLGG